MNNIINLLEYQKLLVSHTRALQQLELDFRFFITDIGDEDVYDVKSRIKKYESAIAKAAKLNIPVSNLDDLVGMRIIVYTQSSISVVERFFSRQELFKKIKIKKRNKISKDSGYRATHLVIESQESFKGCAGVIEIQIQTIFQNAFNTLSRNWAYKNKTPTSKDWNSRFLEISKVLKHLESLANTLHSEVVITNSTEGNAPLTAHTYKIILLEEFNEFVNYEDSVDCVDFYTNIGIETNSDLRRFFNNQKILTLYEEVKRLGEGNSALAPLVEKKSSFWSLFGTRINTPGLHEFFKTVANNTSLHNKS